MFLHLSGLRVDAFQTALPLPTMPYENLTFYGNLKIDDVHWLNCEYTDSQIINTTTEMTWNDVYTILLAHFENTLSAGNINYAIDSWSIKRKKTTDLIYTTIATVPYSSTTSYYFDDSAKNLITYDYSVHAVANYIEGLGVKGSGTLSFFGWVLSDTAATPVTSYLFDLENKTSDIVTNQDFKKYDNYTQYPAFRFGNRQYEESPFSTMPYSYTSGTQIVNDSTILDALRTFINNKSPKILRNSAGQIWEVITTNFSYKYMDEVPEQPYIIQFNWTQIGDGS